MFRAHSAVPQCNEWSQFNRDRVFERSKILQFPPNSVAIVTKKCGRNQIMQLIDDLIPFVMGSERKDVLYQIAQYYAE